MLSRKKHFTISTVRDHHKQRNNVGCVGIFHSCFPITAITQTEHEEVIHGDSSTLIRDDKAKSDPCPMNGISLSIDHYRLSHEL